MEDSFLYNNRQGISVIMRGMNQCQWVQDWNAKEQKNMR